MKTLGRILILLMSFALTMGILYIVVNISTAGSSAATPEFNRTLPLDAERPVLPEGERPDEFRIEHGGWMFGAIKNIGIIAIIVTLIVLPKRWLQKEGEPRSQ